MDTLKVDLVRHILNETNEEVIYQISNIVEKSKTKKPKNLSKYFGKLKRGVDGLTYQKTIRNEWD